jgi:hypothetical protein
MCTRACCGGLLEHDMHLGVCILLIFRACIPVCMPCLPVAAQHSMCCLQASLPVCSCPLPDAAMCWLLLAGGGCFAWWTLLAFWDMALEELLLGWQQCRAGSIGRLGLRRWC